MTSEPVESVMKSLEDGASASIVLRICQLIDQLYRKGDLPSNGLLSCPLKPLRDFCKIDILAPCPLAFSRGLSILLWCFD